MSNEMKDWLTDRKEEAWTAINKIAKIYDDYHYIDKEALDKIGEILKEYNFID